MKDIRVHGMYWLLILIALVIYFATKSFKDVPNVLEAISLAATLASFVVSIIAIGYAFFTSFTSNQTTQNLLNASEKISETSTVISNAANDLSLKVEVIPSRLDSMEGKFDQFLSFNTSSANQEDRGLISVKKDVNSEFPQIFIERMSSIFLMSVYMAFKAHKSKKSINYKNANNIFKEDEIHLANGIWVSLYSFGLMDVVLINDANLNISNFNERISNQINDDTIKALSEKITQDKPINEQEKYLKDLQEDIKAINNYFKE